MQRLMERFCDTLAAEREVHRELLDFSILKRGAITANDVEALDKIVRGEELLLSRLSSLEKKRQDSVQDLAAAIDRPARDVVLMDFIRHSDASTGDRLRELHGDLKGLMEKQIAINELNKRLIESRLEYINFSLETAVGGGQSVYRTYDGGNDRPSPVRKTSFIDRRV